MQFRIRLALAAVIAFATVSTCRADFVPTPTLSLSSNPTDLNHLTIGQTITINVNMTNLAASGAQVTFLGAGVQVVPDPSTSTSPFTTPTTPLAGTIGSLSSSFLAGSSPGTAAGAFIAGVSPIVKDGLFYSFTMTAQATGSGTISFNPTFFIALGPNNNPLPLNGVTDSLHYNISIGVGLSTVPEPSTMLLASVGGVLAFFGAARRVRAARRLSAATVAA